MLYYRIPATDISTDCGGATLSSAVTGPTRACPYQCPPPPHPQYWSARPPSHDSCPSIAAGTRSHPTTPRSVPPTPVVFVCPAPKAMGEATATLTMGLSGVTGLPPACAPLLLIPLRSYGHCWPTVSPQDSPEEGRSQTSPHQLVRVLPCCALALALSSVPLWQAPREPLSQCATVLYCHCFCTVPKTQLPKGPAARQSVRPC